MRILICLMAVSACAAAASACGGSRSTAPSRGSAAGGRLGQAIPEIRRGACPKGVLPKESLFTPIADVTRQAERLLAHQTIKTQGTLYHLTPRNAPIDLVASLELALDAPPSRITVLGIAVIYRHAAALCGKRTASASWAIHYPIPVAEISNAAGWRYLVKTRTGWRFWGNWCGAGRSPSWRAANCY